MGVQSLFLLSDTGEVLFEKHERGRATDRGICSWYWTEVEKYKEQKEVLTCSLLILISFHINTFTACTALTFRYFKIHTISGVVVPPPPASFYVHHSE